MTLHPVPGLFIAGVPHDNDAPFALSVEDADTAAYLLATGAYVEGDADPGALEFSFRPGLTSAHSLEEHLRGRGETWPPHDSR